jgi:hypothetical protein
MKIWYIVLGLLVTLIIFGLLNNDDRKTEVASHETYCEMINLWLIAEANDVPINERPGWPPYNGEEICQ